LKEKNAFSFRGVALPLDPLTLKLIFRRAFKVLTASVRQHEIIIEIGQTVAIEQFIFLRWRSSAILELWGKFCNDAQRVFGGLYHCAKFSWNRFSSLIIRKFEYFECLA